MSAPERHMDVLEAGPRSFTQSMMRGLAQPLSAFKLTKSKWIPGQARDDTGVWGDVGDLSPGRRGLGPGMTLFGAGMTEWQSFRT